MSGRFPTGFVRALEPDPGVHVDAGALAIGGILLLGCLLAWVAVAFFTSRPRRALRARSRHSETIARVAPSPAAATGTNFALTGSEGSSTAALGTILALAFIVAGLVGATAFSASLDDLVTDRARFGANYDFAVGDNSGLSTGRPAHRGRRRPRRRRADAHQRDPGPRGCDDDPIDGRRTRPRRARARVLAGRLPTSRDEVALGRVSARDLDVGVGDTVTLRGSRGEASYRVVGLAVVPGAGGNDGVGKGGIVNPEGFAALETEPSSSMAAIDLRPGAGRAAAERIAAAANTQFGIEDKPGAILNIQRVRNVPTVLAALLALLALLTLVHALIVSIQSRRRDVAVLRALGADRRWVARAVHWQATVLTALPLLFAVPIGLVVGGVVFRAFADRIGAWSDPVLPVVLVLVMMVAFVVIANVAAVIPARRARRLAPAELLTEE